MPEVIKENNWIVRWDGVDLFFGTHSVASLDELFINLDKAGVPLEKQETIHILAENVRGWLYRSLQSGGLVHSDGVTEEIGPILDSLDPNILKSLDERRVVKVRYWPEKGYKEGGKLTSRNIAYLVSPNQTSRLGYQKKVTGVWFDIYKQEQPLGSHLTEMIFDRAKQIRKNPEYLFLSAPRYLVRAVTGQISREFGLGEVG